MEIANSNEIKEVGYIGISIFSFLLLCSLIGFFRSPSVLLTRLFFLSIFFSSLFDIPRYISMIQREEYTSIISYSLHILANYFFFLSLSFVCIVWANLLELGVYSNILFKGYGPIIANIILGIISTITFIYCLNSNSLEDFLKSVIYYIYIFFEVSENLFYSIAIAVLGIKLVLRFKNYTSSGKNNKVQTVAFRKALKKVAVTLSLNAVCSILRVLLRLFFIFHGSFQINSKYFPKYGIFWFIWSDFIPKGVASIVFMNLMASRHSQPRQGTRSISQPSWRFQLSELQSDKSTIHTNTDTWLDDINRDPSIGNRASDMNGNTNMNPINEFEMTTGDLYVDENGNSTTLDNSDIVSQSSSFWDSPTAAQDALSMMTRRQY